MSSSCRMSIVFSVLSGLLIIQTGKRRQDQMVGKCREGHLELSHRWPPKLSQGAPVFSSQNFSKCFTSLRLSRSTGVNHPGPRHSSAAPAGGHLSSRTQRSRHAARILSSEPASTSPRARGGSVLVCTGGSVSLPRTGKWSGRSAALRWAIISPSVRPVNVT